MAYTTTIYPQKLVTTGDIAVTWANGVGTSGGSGGLLTVMYTHAGQDIQDRTGSSEYPTFVGIVNKSLTMRVTLRELKQIYALGSKCTATTLTAISSAGTVTIAAPNMVLRDVEMTQNRAEPAQAVLTFVHESADGTTVPVS